MKRIALGLVALMIASAALAQSWTTLFSASWFLDSAGNNGIEIRTVMPALTSAITQAKLSYSALHSDVETFGHMATCIQSSASTCRAGTRVEVTCNGGTSGLTLSANAADKTCDVVPLVGAVGDHPISIIDISGNAITRNNTSTPSYYSSATTWNSDTMGGSINSAPAPYGVSMMQVAGGPPPPPPIASITASGIPGGGRLTIAHGIARLYGDTQAAYVDYAPDAGVMAPVIDGSGNVQMVQFTTGNTDVTGLTLTLDNSWAANTLHDAYLAFNGTASPPILCSAQWANATTPSSWPTIYKGVKVNSTAITACRTSPTTSIVCAANSCKHVGLFLISPVAGIVRVDFSAGQNRQVGIWNSDNRAPAIVKVTNPSAPFLYNMIGNQQAGGLAPLPSGASWCATPSAGGLCFVGSGTWGPVASDPTLNATVISGNSSTRLTALGSVNHRLLDGIPAYAGVSLPSTPNTAYSLGIGYTPPGGSTWTVCGDFNNYAEDSMGGNSSMNNGEGAALQEVFAATRTTFCDPPPFFGAAQLTLIEAQWWYYGQEWIDSGDDMLTVAVPY